LKRTADQGERGTVTSNSRRGCGTRSFTLPELVREMKPEKVTGGGGGGAG